MFKVGSVVKLDSSSEYMYQSRGHCGIIQEIHASGWVSIKWEHGSVDDYPKSDLIKVIHCDIGDRVRHTANGIKAWGDQSEHSTGTIKNIRFLNWLHSADGEFDECITAIDVKWDAGRENCYPEKALYIPSFDRSIPKKDDCTFKEGDRVILYGKADHRWHRQRRARVGTVTTVKPHKWSGFEGGAYSVRVIWDGDRHDFSYPQNGLSLIEGRKRKTRARATGNTILPEPSIKEITSIPSSYAFEEEEEELIM